MKGIVEDKIIEFNTRRQLKAIVRDAEKEAQQEMDELLDAREMAESAEDQLQDALKALQHARDVASEQAANHWNATHSLWESRARPLASTVVMQANSVKSSMEVVWQAQLLLNARLRDAETGSERRQKFVQAAIANLGIDSTGSLARLANSATRTVGKGVSAADYVRTTALARSKVVDLEQIVPTASKEAAATNIDNVLTQLANIRLERAEQENLLARSTALSKEIVDTKDVTPTDNEINLVALVPAVGATLLAVLVAIVMLTAPLRIQLPTLTLPTVPEAQPQQQQPAPVPAPAPKPVVAPAPVPPPAPAPAPAPNASKAPKDWDYRDIEQWSRDSEWMCSNIGDQSPINIDLSQIAEDCGDVPSLDYYEGADKPFSRVDLKVIVNKHAWEVAYPGEDGPMVKFGGVPYKLVQFHFHTPSEHTLNGKFSDMEVHLVHKSAEGNLLVIGSFLDAAPDRPANAFLEQFWNRFPLGRTAAEVQQFDNLDPYKGLLTNRNAFMTWEGSLTTPPCSNGVRWIMMKSNTYISTAQLQKYRDGTLTVPDNQLVLKDKVPSGVNPEAWDVQRGWSNRPVQPLGDRKICSAKR